MICAPEWPRDTCEVAADRVSLLCVVFKIHPVRSKTQNSFRVAREAPSQYHCCNGNRPSHWFGIVKAHAAHYSRKRRGHNNEKTRATLEETHVREAILGMTGFLTSRTRERCHYGK